MARLAEHPTVKQFEARHPTGSGIARPQTLDREWLRQVCLEAGADDAGFVQMDRPEIADQKADIFYLLPKAKTLISFVVRMNRENIRTPARSIANLEFHHTTDEANEVARKIVAVLEGVGVRADVDHIPGERAQDPAVELEVVGRVADLTRGVQLAGL